VTLTAALNAFRIIAIYLKPVLPVYADKAMKLFGETEWTWDSILSARENCVLGEYEYLASRIDAKQVEAMVEAAKAKPGESGEVSHESRASKNKQAKPAVDAPALKDEIAFADFEKLDLRVGTVESCETVPKSSKLLKFVLDAGSLGKRTIFSGIRGAYPDPAALVGREVVFVANLAPRKMSVGVSEGMILYAGEVGVNGGVISPVGEAGPGTPAT
jgi:methionyl-tRNA synthetase